MEQRPKRTPEDMARDVENLKENGPEIFKRVVSFFNSLLGDTPSDEGKKGEDNGED